MAEGVVERQRLQLTMGCSDQPLFAETQRRTPQTGHCLQVTITLVVDDINTVAALDDQWPFLLVRTRIGVGVEVKIDIALSPRFCRVRHARILYKR
ncbi:hypothetical protein D3C84_720030 [compost metagenome]